MATGRGRLGTWPSCGRDVGGRSIVRWPTCCGVHGAGCANVTTFIATANPFRWPAEDAAALQAPFAPTCSAAEGRPVIVYRTGRRSNGSSPVLRSASSPPTRAQALCGVRGAEEHAASALSAAAAEGGLERSARSRRRALVSPQAERHVLLPEQLDREGARRPGDPGLSTVTKLAGLAQRQRRAVAARPEHEPRTSTDEPASANDGRCSRPSRRPARGAAARRAAARESMPASCLVVITRGLIASTRRVLLHPVRHLQRLDERQPLDLSSGCGRRDSDDRAFSRDDPGCRFAEPQSSTAMCVPSASNRASMRSPARGCCPP